MSNKSTEIVILSVGQDYVNKLIRNYKLLYVARTTRPAQADVLL